MYLYLFLLVVLVILYYNFDLMKIPYVRKKYQEKVDKELKHFKNKCKKNWEKFGTPIIKLPKEGFSEQKIMELIGKYSSIVRNNVRNKQFSGTIYGDALRNESFTDIQPTLDSNGLFTKLRRLYTYAYEQSYLWNSLHNDEFGIASFIDYQIIQIVGHMFGSNKNITGFVTTGGTESLMDAIRCYRNWGINVKGHKLGESVILASDMIHAAVLKSDVKVVLIKSVKGKIDLVDLQDKLDCYYNRVVAVFVSAPCYPLGTIDPIEQVSKLVEKYKCGLHVDCCLGGFVVNFLPLKSKETKYLSLKGVTSLSVDTHKNGLAPKGSSVLITKYMGDKPLSYYSIYSIPDWSGGIYGTPGNAGSRSVVNSLTTLVALLVTGKNKYKYFANEINVKTYQLANIIKKFEGKLSLVVEPEVNVVAFRIDPNMKIGKGAIYAFAYEMSKRGIILNTLANDMVHYCVTMRFVNDKDALSNFQKATNESLTEVMRLNATGAKFPGDAGIYCALDEAMNPNMESGIKTYIENKLFGKRAAHDVVKNYFIALLNPYN